MTVNCPGCEGQIEIPRGTAPQAPNLSLPATPEKPQAAVFYVGRGGTELGQFNEQEFRDKILTGSIRPGDHYWKEGMDDWQLVSEYRGLPSPDTFICGVRVGYRVTGARTRGWWHLPAHRPFSSVDDGIRDADRQRQTSESSTCANSFNTLSNADARLRDSTAQR